MQPVIQHGYIVPLTKKENAAVSRLVRAATSRGLSIQVWNGAEDMLPQPSQDVATILLMLGSTGEDTLQVWDGDHLAGWFHFVWGGPDIDVMMIASIEAEPMLDEIYGEAFAS